MKWKKDKNGRGDYKYEAQMPSGEWLTVYQWGDGQIEWHGGGKHQTAETVEEAQKAAVEAAERGGRK